VCFKIIGIKIGGLNAIGNCASWTKGERVFRLMNIVAVNVGAEHIYLNFCGTLNNIGSFNKEWKNRNIGWLE
jgi:hypothetical protein